MKKNNVFWVGYADLMTSLFFVMLVLFVVTIAYLQIKNKENEELITELEKKTGGLIKEKERLEKLLNLEEQFEPLIQDDSFYYDTLCRKFYAKSLMGIEIFEPEQTKIKEEYKKKALDVGKKIEDLLRKLSSQNKEFSYLLVIEGNMANFADRKKRKDENDNWGYETSYKRALEVYYLWLKNNINFRRYNTEVLICGSGFSGLCRDSIEENNKRFSVQIIPKVSK